MKIAVLGAGAMGGLFSAYLSRQNEVTVIDVNPAVVEKINADGLTVTEPDGASAVYHPHAVLSTEGMAPVDLIVVFVKAMFSESALTNNKGIIGPDTYLMTLQNGSGHEDLLGKFVPQDHIIIGTTQHNASVAGPGATKHGGSGTVHQRFGQRADRRAAGAAGLHFCQRARLEAVLHADPRGGGRRQRPGHGL